MVPGTMSLAAPPAPVPVVAPKIAIGPGVITRVRLFVHDNTLAPSPVWFQIMVTPGAGSSTTDALDAVVLWRIPGFTTGAKTIQEAPLPITLTSATDAIDVQIVSPAIKGSLHATALIDIDDTPADQ